MCLPETGFDVIVFDVCGLDVFDVIVFVGWLVVFVFSGMFSYNCTIITIATIRIIGNPIDINLFNSIDLF